MRDSLKTMTDLKRSGNLEAGQELAGRYSIEKMLGMGGMGAVYVAEHIALKRRVALKVLLSERTMDERTVQRFKQEAQSAASIGHPGIVEIFDLGEDEETGQTFIAMELLEGEELASRVITGHPLSPVFVAQVGADLTDAIAAAHSHGIVHRDLKPENVFLARKGRHVDIVKVLDFGLAKLIDRKTFDTSITRSGDVFGTPMYMAPEQLRGAKEVDGRADVYAIGAILYEALTGNTPFEASHLAELVLKIMVDPIEPLVEVRPDVPEELALVVEKAMEKEPDDRFQSALEVRDALEEFLDSVGGNKRASVRSRATAVSDPEPPVAKSTDTFPSVSEKEMAAELSEASQRTTKEASRTEQEASPVRRQSSKALYGVAVVLVLVVVGMGLYIAYGGSSEEIEDSSTPARPEPVVASVEPSVEVIEAGFPAPEAGPDVAPSGASKRKVRFISQPLGALIEAGDGISCETPCDLELDDVVSNVTAKLAGYESKRHRLEPPLPSNVELRLRRTKGRGKTSTPTAPPREKASDPPPLLPR